MASRRRKKGRRKRGVYSSIKMKTPMTYRSGWELEYFKYLDSLESVANFFSESLKIQYVSNVKTGKTRNYIPDLLVEYVDGNKVLIEIKPSSKISQRVNVKKFAAAQKYCDVNGIRFQIITERDLKELGLLK